MDHNQQPNDNAEGRVYSETFVFTGNGGQSFLTTMQNLMNRIVNGAQPGAQQPPPEPQTDEQGEGDSDMALADDPPVPDLPEDDDISPLEPFTSEDSPPSPRPMRPLPRPHAHFHAHTPSGVIDLFTFNVAAPPPPPPGGANASFTFNIGTDVLAGFEAFFLGMPGMKDREPDPERARVLVKGMETVPEGLVRRLERAGGVPGGHGTEENAGCAVCWGPLLDEIEPGEWDTAKEKEEREREKSPEKEKASEDDELHGRIIALPCAHVYHAECLLPWFSRQTTCPTCRLDVDPESLTWTPRPPPTPPTHDAPPPPNAVPENDAAPPHDAPPPSPPHDALPPHPHAEQHRHANAAEAARLNAFMTSILRAMPLPAHPNPPASPQDTNEIPSDPLVFGPPPPPPPQPHPHPHFMPIPMFFAPPPHAHAVPNSTSNLPHPPPAPNINLPHTHAHPNINFPHAHPNIHFPHAHPNINIPHLHPHAHTNSPRPAPPPRERKKWTPPEPVDRTLRQRVEAKERELGLRCADVVCGVAPSDEDPAPVVSTSESAGKRVTIRAAYDAHGKACEHEFHPACLVTSARVAGVTEDEEREGGDGEEVQVACPACRAVGSLSRAEWEEGVRASEAEMA